MSLPRYICQYNWIQCTWYEISGIWAVGKNVNGIRIEQLMYGRKLSRQQFKSFLCSHAPQKRPQRSQVPGRRAGHETAQLFPIRDKRDITYSRRSSMFTTGYSDESIFVNGIKRDGRPRKFGAKMTQRQEGLEWVRELRRIYIYIYIHTRNVPMREKNKKIWEYM